MRSESIGCTNQIPLLKKGHILSLVLLLLLINPLNLRAETISGVFQVTWGDSFQNEQREQIQYNLTTETTGTIYRLRVIPQVLEESGGVRALFGKNVSIITSTVLPSGDNIDQVPLDVLSISILDGDQSPPVNVSAIGQSEKYVSILCKYAENSDEPQSLSFFQNMYGDNVGELNHYWKEVSSNNINVDGSTAHGWYNLPQTRDFYLNSGNTLNLLFDDCTSVADADIDFTGVNGINLMFNDLINCCAWGGGKYATLDGVARVWATTWEPPWGWGNVTVMAHEMGHSFGLPHSNNFDLDSSPYDNTWTVMSGAWVDTNSHPTYGDMGKHINAYEKDILGWFTPSETYTHGTTQQTINIDPINFELAGPSAYRLAKIPVNSADIDYYTVEVRVNGTPGGDYDSALPGSAIVIHEVKLARSEPSWVVDSDSPPSDFSNTEGTMWKVGEVFEDSANNVRVSVDALTANGFEVTIGYDSASAPDTVTALIWPTGVINNSAPEFSWIAVDNADDYRIIVVDIETGGTDFYSTWQASSSLGCPAVSDNCSFSPGETFLGEKKWRVQARNSVGKSDWSTPWYFTVESQPIPDVVTNLIQPVGQIPSTQPVFSWMGVDNADEYRIFLVDIGSGNTLHFSPWIASGTLNCQGMQTCEYAPGITVLDSSRWRVQARNSVGRNTWSNAQYFDILTDPPAQVVTLNPSGEIPTNSPEYVWEPAANATQYKLAVKNLDTGTIVISQTYTAADAGCLTGLNNCSITPATTVSGNLRWWVQSRNSSGKAVWSLKTDFTSR